MVAPNFGKIAQNNPLWQNVGLSWAKMLVINGLFVGQLPRIFLPKHLCLSQSHLVKFVQFLFNCFSIHLKEVTVQLEEPLESEEDSEKELFDVDIQSDDGNMITDENGGSDISDSDEESDDESYSMTSSAEDSDDKDSDDERLNDDFDDEQTRNFVK